MGEGRDVPRFPHRGIRRRAQGRRGIHPLLQRGTADVLPRLHDAETVQGSLPREGPASTSASPVSPLARRGVSAEGLTVHETIGSVYLTLTTALFGVDYRNATLT